MLLHVQILRASYNYLSNHFTADNAAVLQKFIEHAITNVNITNIRVANIDVNILKKSAMFAFCSYL